MDNTIHVGVPIESAAGKSSVGKSPLRGSHLRRAILTKLGKSPHTLGVADLSNADWPTQEGVHYSALRDIYDLSDDPNRAFFELANARKKEIQKDIGVFTDPSVVNLLRAYNSGGLYFGKGYLARGNVFALPPNSHESDNTNPYAQWRINVLDHEMEHAADDPYTVGAVDKNTRHFRSWKNHRVERPLVELYNQNAAMGVPLPEDANLPQIKDRVPQNADYMPLAGQRSLKSIQNLDTLLLSMPQDEDTEPTAQPIEIPLPERYRSYESYPNPEPGPTPRQLSKIAKNAIALYRKILEQKVPEESILHGVPTTYIETVADDSDYSSADTYWDNFERTGDVVPKPSRPWKIPVAGPKTKQKAMDELGATEDEVEMLSQYARLLGLYELLYTPDNRVSMHGEFIKKLQSLLQR